MRPKYDDHHFFERLEKFKKIAAIKKPKDIEKAVEQKETLSAVYLLTGNIGVLKKYVDVFKEKGLPIFIHTDKIGGLSLDQDGMTFLSRYVMPTGIVTTKPSQIINAKKCGLVGIQRVFVIDSEVIENLITKIDHHKPDAVEIMPARVPEVIQILKQNINVPIIAGGLLQKKEHALESLNNGASAVSTSNTDLWKIDFQNK